MQDSPWGQHWSFYTVHVFFSSSFFFFTFSARCVDICVSKKDSFPLTEYKMEVLHWSCGLQMREKLKKKKSCNLHKYWITPCLQYNILIQLFSLLWKEFERLLPLMTVKSQWYLILWQERRMWSLYIECNSRNLPVVSRTCRHSGHLLYWPVHQTYHLQSYTVMEPMDVGWLKELKRSVKENPVK